MISASRERRTCDESLEMLPAAEMLSPIRVYSAVGRFPRLAGTGSGTRSGGREYSQVTEDTSNVDTHVGAALGAPRCRFR
jgi:hypothetical protein